jgi:hypothetical protein
MIRIRRIIEKSQEIYAAEKYGIEGVLGWQPPTKFFAATFP